MAAKRRFSDVVSSLEERHSNVLMTRARAANRIAKTVRGRSRQRAYAVKHTALTALIDKLPERVSVRPDIGLDGFVVVELTGSRSGLHMPGYMI